MWNNLLINPTHMELECAYETVHAFMHMHRAANVISIILLRTRTNEMPHLRIVFICIRCVTVIRNRERGSRRVTPAPSLRRLGEWRQRNYLKASVFLSHRIRPQLRLTRFCLVGHMRNKRCRVIVGGKKEMPVRTY